MAEGRPGYGEAAPGDHVQAAYQLWLPGHQLARGGAPWKDPYSFQPLVEPRTTFAGWPFALVFGPLHALLGTVGAWNVLVLLSYVAAGLATFAWLRTLDVPRAAALAGGLVFTLAPYRAGQLAAGHQLVLVAVLLPLALWALERRFVVLAALALASIPRSGQVHLPMMIECREHRLDVLELVAKDPRPYEAHVHRAEPIRQRAPRWPVAAAAAEREPATEIEIRPVAVDLQTAVCGQRKRALVEAQRAAIELRLAVAVAEGDSRVRAT